MPAFDDDETTNPDDATDLSQAQQATKEAAWAGSTESWAPKQYRASIGKKPLLRSQISSSSSSATPPTKDMPNWKLDTLAPEEEDAGKHPPKGDESLRAQQNLLTKVAGWLQAEKAKKQARKSKQTAHPEEPSEDLPTQNIRRRTGSGSSDSSLALEDLERILADFAIAGKEAISSAVSSHKAPLRHRRSMIKGLRRGSNSDSEAYDVEASVPNVDATLDNSRTLAYGGGEADEAEVDEELKKTRANDREYWHIFKREIVKLTHTLRLKGWRRVALENSAEIDVVRLSGALTNAVYVVSPPKTVSEVRTDDSQTSLVVRKPPPKLLLRIYGPQVEHLIDRENELQILRRLGRKNIGPRVLGTFNNGRFEEFFHARTLTPQDLRRPDISRQIAKRMRELHDGVELLDEEREGGPFVWKNWEKWLDRLEHIMPWLDQQIELEQKVAGDVPPAELWRRRGFVCVTPWPVFRRTVEIYRKWLLGTFGGLDSLNRRLVFAHNDTQYGNLLRLEPSGESPLLLPANEHKRLVVIDFEYSSANTPGFEFANHFTEWCYNYHDAERPWACNVRGYPTPEEQYRFISAYVHHRPKSLPLPASTATPQLSQAPSYSSVETGTPLSMMSTANPSISTPRLAPFNLDAQGSLPYTESETLRDQAAEAEIQRLQRETRLWRMASSAQWVAWGMVQAKVPGMEEELAAAVEQKAAPVGSAGEPQQAELSPSDGAVEGQVEGRAAVPEDSEVDEAEEFDYLAYAQDRALFFWADALTLGIVTESELPADLIEHIKTRTVEY